MWTKFPRLTIQIIKILKKKIVVDKGVAQFLTRIWSFNSIFKELKFVIAKNNSHFHKFAAPD